MNDIQQVSEKLKGIVESLRSQQPGINKQNTETHNEFGDVFNHAIEKLAQQQQDAEHLKLKYELGGPGAPSLEELVLSLQQASMSFQEMVQVRNKLVSAYTEIMNMQV